LPGGSARRRDRLDGKPRIQAIFDASREWHAARKGDGEVVAERRLVMSLIRSLLHAVAAIGTLVAVSTGIAADSQARSRIKDIADFEGIRQNKLIGYGLVIGLNGTGDTLNNSPFTQQSIIAMLERLGVNTRDIAGSLRTRNVAAVMVTATLPPFARLGSRIDVSVGTFGDSTSLQGGTLLVTPLLGADGEVYAVAQGAVAVGGFTATGQGAQVTRNIPTSAKIAGGGVIERELGFQLASLESVKIALRNPDLTTARRIAQAINNLVRAPIARPLDPGTVLLLVPDSRRGDLVNLLTDIEQLPVDPDQIARVVIDEKTGTIVMGDAVRISTVAIAHGNLTIRITETPQVSQPNPFAPQGTGAPTLPGQITGGAIAPGGATVVVPRTQVDIDEQNDRRLAILPQGVTLQELVNGLNALGFGPRDMITILQAIKAAGALQADIEVM
jgi:flagellar P-ring protein precursor FlgI